MRRPVTGSRLTQTPSAHIVRFARRTGDRRSLFYHSRMRRIISLLFLNRLLVCRSGRTRETRASCSGGRVGWDASGFCDRAEYSDALEACARRRDVSKPSCGISECNDGKWHGHGDRCLSRQERNHCEPCLSTGHRSSPRGGCRTAAYS